MQPFPGTPFMDRLSKFLRHYISVRVQENPLWKDLVVFFSDSNEPSGHRRAKLGLSGLDQPGLFFFARYVILIFDPRFFFNLDLLFWRSSLIPHVHH